MRTHKYRVYDKANKRMVYFDGLEVADFLLGERWFMAASSIEKEANRGLKPDFSELMQCTGMQDEDGKEIWEGDILECFGVVKFGHFNNGKRYEDASSGIGFYTEDLFSLDPELKYKKLGSTWENPELLEAR